MLLKEIIKKRLSHIKNVDILTIDEKMDAILGWYFGYSGWWYKIKSWLEECNDCVTGYKAKSQTDKNIAWFLPRPKPDHYKGGMPLYCEEWIVNLAKDLIGDFDTEKEMLNLFCGKNKYGYKIDIKPYPETNADIVYDVHKISEIPFKNKFKFIFADPPYSTEEAKDIYGTPPLKYKKWTAECDKLLDNGGLLCVYHKYIMPNPNSLKYEIVKRVFIGSRTYHLPRVAIFFRKK